MIDIQDRNLFHSRAETIPARHMVAASCELSQTLIIKRLGAARGFRRDLLIPLAILVPTSGSELSLFPCHCRVGPAYAATQIARANAPATPEPSYYISTPREQEKVLRKPLARFASHWGVREAVFQNHMNFQAATPVHRQSGMWMSRVGFFPLCFFPQCFMAKATKSKDASKEGEQATNQPKRRPIHSIREADVSLSVWSREVTVRGEERTFYSVTVERSYRDSMGQYRYTRSFDPQSLPPLVSLIQRASEYIFHLENPDSMLPSEDQEKNDDT